MNKVSATKKYLRTLGTVYMERGLAGALMHEVSATVLSIGTKVQNTVYFLCDFSELGDNYGDYYIEHETFGRSNRLRLARETYDRITNPMFLHDFLCQPFLPKRKQLVVSAAYPLENN